MKRLLSLLLAIAPVIGAFPVQAQVSSATVVSSCGTPPISYTAGYGYPVTQDTSGKFCTNATSGGGTQNANITQWNSVALGSPSAYGTSPGGVVVPGVNAFVTGGNITQINGSSLSLGNTNDAGSLPVTQSSTQFGTAAAAYAPLSGAAGLYGAMTTLAYEAQQPIPAGTALIGKVGIDQTTPGTTNGVTPVAAAAGGATPYALQSAASTNATNVKNAAGTVYGVHAFNTTTTIYYLRMYNLGSAPTCSSATGFVETFPVPPASAAGGAGGFTLHLPVGVAYGTGIGFCLTGGGSSTDNTNAATGVYINIDYK